MHDSWSATNLLALLHPQHLANSRIPIPLFLQASPSLNAELLIDIDCCTIGNFWRVWLPCRHCWGNVKHIRGGDNTCSHEHCFQHINKLACDCLHMLDSKGGDGSDSNILYMTKIQIWWRCCHEFENIDIKHCKALWMSKSCYRIKLYFLYWRWALKL